MLRLFNGLFGRHITLVDRGEERAIFIVTVVHALFVKREKSGKFHDLPSRTQAQFARTVRQIDGGPLHPCRGHLAGQGPLVDQIIKPRMIARPHLVAIKIGRADRFVRFLGIFRLCLVNPWLVGKISGIIAICDRTARRGNGTAVHLHTIGTHIGDRAILIEILGNAHRVARRKTQLARGFLL